jgi:hypothetical protein
VRGWHFIQGGGDHCEKVVFKAYSSQYSPYFLGFVQEKRENKVSKGVAVAETPTGGSATAIGLGKQSHFLKIYLYLCSYLSIMHLHK